MNLCYVHILDIYPLNMYVYRLIGLKVSVILFSVGIAFNYENSTHHTCLQNVVENPPTYTDGLITFSFFFNETAARRFRVPRCIFTNSLTEYLFTKMNIYKDAETYQKDFKRLYLSSVKGTFKMILNLIAHPSIYIEKTKIHIPSTVNNFEAIISENIKYIEPMPFYITNKTVCEIFSSFDSYVLPYFSPCVPFSLESYNIRLSGTLTDKFFMFVLTTSTVSAEFIFGRPSSIVIKPPYESQDLTLRQTSRDDLIVIGEEAAIEYMLSFISMNFMDKLLASNYDDPAVIMTNMIDVFRLYIGMVSSNTVTDKQHVFEMYFCTVLAFYVHYARPLENRIAPLRSFITREIQVYSIRELTSMIFPNSNLGNILQIQRVVYLNAMGKDIKSIEERDVLPYIFLYRMYTGNITEEMAQALDSRLHTLYQKVTYPLQPDTDLYDGDMIKDMFLIHASHKHLNLKYERTLFLLTTAMCNPRTILSQATRIHKNGVTSLYEFYSPCFYSGRFDLTYDKVKSMLQLNGFKYDVPYVSGISNGNVRQIQLKSMKCIQDMLGAVTIIPLPSQTYVVSSVPIVKGVVYTVTTTRIGLRLLITAPFNNTCTPSANIFQHGVMKTLTDVKIDVSTGCVVCPAVIMEYNVNHGFTAFHVISTVTDLVYLASDNPLISPNSNYLLLLNNGSVYELQGDSILSVRQRSILLIAVYVCLILIFSILLYKILRLFCK